MRIPGGVSSHIADLAKALTDAGHRCLILSPSERFHSPLWKAVALFKGGSVDAGRLALTQMRLANLGRRISRAAESGSFSVVHAHDVFAARVAQCTRLPLVLTVHGPLSKEIRMLMGKRSPRYLGYAQESETVAYAGARRIIAVDSGQRDTIVQEYGVDPRKIHVIANAVDTDLFVPFSTPLSERRYLLVPRRLVKKNGVDVAIRAFALVDDKQIELWIAGDGPEEPHLRNLVRQLRLSDRVRFLGPVCQRTKMATLVAQARAVLIPSVPVEGVVEATSIAALEAMSCGVPVFASRVGGLTEIIEDGETGFLFEAGNWEELGSLLKNALCDTDTLATVGRAARAYVQANHSLPGWVSRVISVYEEAIRG